jgi:hypothetical protein
VPSWTEKGAAPDDVTGLTGANLSGVRFDASVTTSREFATSNTSAVFRLDAPDSGTTVTLGSSPTGGRLVKAVADTVVPNNAGTTAFTGAVQVDGGRLRSNGQTSAGNAVTVLAGGALGGTGTTRRPTTVRAGSTPAPGATPGSLTYAQPVMLAPGSTLAVELNGPTAGTGSTS